MRILSIAFGSLAILVAPNLIWLATSTLRIENKTGAEVAGLAYRACDTEFSVSAIASGDSVFRLLPACGDDTLTVILGGRDFCQIYVEGDLYHIDARIESGRVACEYGDPLSSLLVVKIL